MGLIANLGAAASGGLRGFQQAQEDKFAEEERNRKRKDWATQDKIEQGLAGIRGPGEYTDTVVNDTPYVGSAAQLDPAYGDRTGGIDADMPAPAAAGVPRTGLSSYQQKTTRTDADVMADMANVYRGAGKGAEYIQALNSARMERQGQRQDKIDAKRDAAFADYGKMVAMLQSPDGHKEFARIYGPQFNADQIGGPEHAGAKVAFDPEFKRVIYLNKDGQVAGDASWTPQTAMQAAQTLFEARLAAISPQDYAQQQELGLRRREVGAKEVTAKAHDKTADAAVAKEKHLITVPLANGQVAVFNQTTGELGKPQGPVKVDPSSIQKPNLSTAYITVQDPITRKPIKQPVRTAVVWEGGKPITKAWTLDGKPITDLSSLAGADQEGKSPAAARYEALRQSVFSNNQLDATEKSRQLAALDKEENTAALRAQLPSLKPEERVPEARRLLAAGLFTADELAKNGFSFSELKQAQQAPQATAANRTATGVINNAPSQQVQDLRKLVTRGVGLPTQQPPDWSQVQPGPVPYGVQRW